MQRSAATCEPMNLTAVFESWHIGDGNYPPLRKGQAVNLSFELEPSKIEEASLDIPESFESLENAEYRFCGTVVRVYEGLMILQACDFLFYLASSEKHQCREGRRYCGIGTLLLDHYSWVECLAHYDNPPNLFYNLEVKRILRVNVPEKFITRHEKGKSFPTRLVPSDYSISDVGELDTMAGQSFDEEFYIIEFDDSGLEGSIFPRTFIS